MKTHVKESKEETGKAPDCTGAVLEIKRIQRQAVKKADSEFVGCAQYVVQLSIQKPAAAAGMTVFDRIRVGTPEDLDAIQKTTWSVSEGGPARIRRLLSRSGTALTADDEEWMADAVGRTVVAPIVNRGDYTNVGLYYREADKDCPVIGLAGPGGGSRKTRPAAVEEEETEEATETTDEEEAPKPKPKPKPAPVEEEEEEAPKPKPKPKPKPPIEEEED